MPACEWLCHDQVQAGPWKSFLRGGLNTVMLQAVLLQALMAPFHWHTAMGSWCPDHEREPHVNL